MGIKKELTDTAGEEYFESTVKSADIPKLKGTLVDGKPSAGEIDQPGRNIPFALMTGLFICAVVYTVFQLVVLQTIGTAATDRSVVETASVLIGNAEGPFVAVAVMLSTYGWLSGS